jgi:cobalamin biosynthetic protein CobC
VNATPPAISLQPILHGGGVTEAARAYGGAPEDWLDLSTGINPRPVDLPAIPAEAWHRLPDRHLVDAARQAAKAHYGAASCLPLPVPGTQSVIQHLPGFCDPARPVAVLSPTYGEYARVLAEAGLRVDLIPDLAAVRPEHGLVVAVNPNNPTGRLLPRAALLDLAERLHARGARLHVDEAFADFAPGESLAADAGRVAGLTVFRSFGKFFGLAGLRLGFVLAGEADLARIANRLGPWPVSGPALVVAAKLMAGDHSATRRDIAERHAALIAVLDKAGLSVIGGAGLFVLVDHPKAGLLHAHLCRHHILVRQFDYERRWLRFGLAPDAAALERLARALTDF